MVRTRRRLQASLIERVKETLDELKPTLPPGMEIVPTYDRSELIDRSIENLKGTLIEELAIVSLVILIFLLHVPSAMVPIITIPLALLFSFIPMHAMGLSANIRSHDRRGIPPVLDGKDLSR